VRLKLDENLGKRAAELCRTAGHDVATVAAEGLCSADDPKILAVCLQEERCLVTLDIGFGNPLLYKPSHYLGLAVLRPPDRACPSHLVDAVKTLLQALEREPIKGKLWIVQIGRVRVHQEESSSEQEETWTT